MEALSGNQEEELKVYQEKQRVYQEAYNKALTATAEPWHTVEWDANAWKTIKLPVLWEQTEMGNYDGFAWFRKTVDVPEAWAGKDAVVSLGPIDDQDWTWVNGVQVGHTADYVAKRSYKIPAAQVKAGKMQVAIRVLDTGGAGGVWGTPAEMKLTQEGQPDISLAGDWKYSKSKAMDNLPPMPEPMPFSGANTPTALYNGMIAPLVPYTIQGAIWYQGESNSSRGKAVP